MTNRDATSVRAIFALEPAIPVVERLALLQDDLGDPLRLLGADVRWTPPEQIRLILRIAEVDALDVPWLRAGLRDTANALAAPTFSVVGAAFLPALSSPRLVAARAVDDGGQLAELRTRIEALLAPTRARGEQQPWEPWIAVGRLKTTADVPRLDGVLTPFSETQFGESRCATLALVTSRLVGDRARQDLVERAAFAA